jgi:hypothetical protein
MKLQFTRLTAGLSGLASVTLVLLGTGFYSPCFRASLERTGLQRKPIVKNAILAAAAACLTLSACSIREGRIATPADFAATTEQLELRGMGGGRKGDFRWPECPARSPARRSGRGFSILSWSGTKAAEASLWLPHRWAHSFRRLPLP